LKQGVTLVGRLRKDSALFDLPPVETQTRRGRLVTISDSQKVQTENPEKVFMKSFESRNGRAAFI
jgi:hypothetical protein